MTANKPKDIRYEEILGAASKCFAEKGRHNTRIDDIADEAALTKGGVYWHFKNKQEIYLAMVERNLREDMEFWEATIAKEEIGPDSLEKCGIAYLRYATDNKYHACLHAEMRAESFRDEGLKAKLHMVHQKWRTMIGDFVRSIFESMGKEVENAELEGISSIILSCMEGFTHQYWLNGNESNLDHFENAWKLFANNLLK